MEDVEDIEVHCTNVAIQKHGEHYNAEVSAVPCVRCGMQHGTLLRTYRRVASGICVHSRCI